ncbi:MAG: hypothetical protein GXO22_04380 [Aquificae bacterium]|nr:hypothetical protein [Aquificota bacterium]
MNLRKINNRVDIVDRALDQIDCELENIYEHLEMNFIKRITKKIITIIKNIRRKIWAR